MPKYKLIRQSNAKALLCLFLLSKNNYKAHSGSSRTAVRFFVCLGGDKNAQNAIRILLPHFHSETHIFDYKYLKLSA